MKKKLAASLLCTSLLCLSMCTAAYTEDVPMTEEEILYAEDLAEETGEEVFIAAVGTEEDVLIMAQEEEFPEEDGLVEDDAVLEAAEGYDGLIIHVTNVVFEESLKETQITIPTSFSQTINETSVGIYNYVCQPRIFDGCTYTFQKAFVLADKDSGIATGSDDGKHVKKITLNGYGDVTVLFEDDDKLSLGNISEYPELYISPLYSVMPNCQIIFYYTDRVGLQSGGWTNGPDNPVLSYTHTFSDPSVGHPVAHYQFVYWRNPDDGLNYLAGEHITIFAEGNDQNVHVYAIWQPSVTVNYHVSGKIEKSVESFESVSVYGYRPDAQNNGTAFDGWYDSKGNKIENETSYKAPEKTGETEVITQPAVYDVYARFSAPAPHEEKTTIGKKPFIKKPIAAKTSITVKWSHFKHTSRKMKPLWKKIKKVEVQCATDKGFTNIVKTSTVGKSRTKAKIKGLSKNTTYYVR
ncbi:MAG: hypothetical protein II718_00950, partial [Clostridiales bacterium]|nr:hypothetical protein [Clostridiales bacterium]